MKNWQEKREASRLRVIESEMPNSKQAEQIVLGTLLSFPHRLEEVIGILRPSDFYVVRHRALYETMLAYYHKHGRPADYLTLSEMLFGNKDIGAADLVDLRYLSDEIWSVDLLQDVRLIIGTHIQRRHIEAAGKLATIGQTVADPDEARTAVEKLLYELGQDRPEQSDFRPMSDVMTDCITDIEIACQNRGKLLGIDTGFADLNALTNGLQRSDLIILAARPGFGKTSLGMGIGYNAARKGKTVAVFSLEMGAKQLGMRLIALDSRVSSNRLRAGWIEEDEMQRVVNASDRLAELPIHIDDTMGAPISSITSKLRRLSARLHRSVDLVIVDYLQLMEDEGESAERRENRNQELSKISRGLKRVAREFNVPVLALAQLSRDVERRQSKIPQLSDLRDSGALEQDADIVMFIYRDEIYDPQSERKGIADVIIAKHRNGPVGTVSLGFNNALTRFEEIASSPAEEDADIESID